MPAKGPRAFIELPATAAMLLAAFYIVTSSVALVVEHHIPYPLWDHWEELLPSRFLENPISQHNEHRILFGRLFFAVDSWLFGGQGHFSLAIVVLSLLGSAALLALAATRGPGSARSWAPVLALSSGFLMSAYAWECLLSSFQASYVGVCPAAIGAILLASRRDAGPSTLALSLLVAFVAAFSLASGLLVPWLVLAMLWVTGRPGRQLAEVAAIASLITFVYLFTYVRPMHHADPWATLSDPVGVLRYLAVYFGAPLSIQFREGRFLAATVTGALGLAWVAALLTRRFVRRRFLEATDWALPCVALFALGWGGMTALGRMNFSLGSAVSSRYGTPALLLWCALFAEGYRASSAPLRRLGIGALGLLGLVPLAMEQEAMARYGAQAMNHIPEGETALLTGALETAVIDRITPGPRLVTDALPVLEARRWSVFGHPWASWLDAPIEAHAAERHAGGCVGYLDAAHPVPSYGAPAYRVRGWAYDLSAGQSVERVALINEADRVVGLALGGQPRPDVPRVMNVVHANDTGFVGHVGHHGRESARVQAVAVLADGTACALEPRLALDHDAARRLVRALPDP